MRKISLFCRKCGICTKRNICISATDFVKGSRKYYLNINGIKEPFNERMLKGKLLHESFQSRFKTLEHYGYQKFKKDFTSGKEIELKELQICSPKYALKGIIDIVKMRQIENNKINIEFTELKSSYWKPYLYQIACYALILSDPHMRIIIQDYKQGRIKNRDSFRLYPEECNFNVKGKMHVFKTESEFKDMIINNELTDEMKNFLVHIKKKAKTFRRLHNIQIKHLFEIPKCPDCNPEFCGLIDVCSKARYTKIKDLKQKKIKVISGLTWKDISVI